MHVAALLRPVRVVAGASSGAPPVPAFAWQLLNGKGDLFQLSLQLKNCGQWGTMTKEQTVSTFTGWTLFRVDRVTGKPDDLFIKYSSWFEYANTNRIFKNYHRISS